MRLHRDTVSPLTGDVGMAIEEAKTLLLAVQQEIVVEQIARFCQRRCQTQ